MKTVICKADGSLEVVEVGIPKIGRGQALTRTIANGICGTDVHLMLKAFKGITTDMYPIMLGHENVGEVVEVGSGVTTFKVGDKVLLPFLDADKMNVGPYESAWGGLSEYCVVHDPAFDHHDVYKNDLAKAQCIIPDFIDPVDAVMLVTFGEVLSAVKYFGIQKDCPVVIFGAGPVGMTFIKMCKMIGASPVISVVRNNIKKKNAEDAEADIIFNSSEIDVDAKIREMYPAGVRYVIDAVGSPQIVNEAMGLICDRGEICCYGVPRQEEIHLDFSKADYNWVLNFQQMPRKEEEAIAHTEIIEWIRQGKLEPKKFISDYYNFDNVIQAYQDAFDKKIYRKGVVIYK